MTWCVTMFPPASLPSNPQTYELESSSSMSTWIISKWKNGNNRDHSFLSKVAFMCTIHIKRHLTKYVIHNLVCHTIGPPIYSNGLLVQAGGWMQQGITGQTPIMLLITTGHNILISRRLQHRFPVDRWLRGAHDDLRTILDISCALHGFFRPKTCVFFSRALPPLPPLLSDPNPIALQRPWVVSKNTALITFKM